MYGFGIAGGLWGGVIADQLAVPFADAMLVPLPDGIDVVAAASVADNVSDGYRHVAPHLPALSLCVGGSTKLPDHALTTPGLPQWSPPVIGGSTEPSARDSEPVGVPQWSPPVIGGSRARKI